MISLKKKMLMASVNVRIKPQDVFATSLYTGNGGTQTITNGLDLAGKGGLTWLKPRSTADDHYLFDTARGAGLALKSQSTQAEENNGRLSAFLSNGFTLNAVSAPNQSGVTNVGWSFRRAKKFFDIVTYTGNGASTRSDIPHSLGQKPGMVVIKRLDAPSDWFVSHRSVDSLIGGNPARLILNSTAGYVYDSSTAYAGWANGSTDTTLQIGSLVNVQGARYIAYLFAQNPDLIDCGSYDGTGNTPGPIVTCGKGWTPQFILAKRATAASDWFMLDATRGMGSGADKQLLANTSQAENTADDFVDLTATGFRPRYLMNSASSSFVYLAIRSPT